ncbi:phage tail tube protein [Weissella viridescens]|uniref:phage tail tube protein n=1 Tax=Weissella viridescens TaxID=1629 RepID=UPI001FD3FA1F|nr:capsid protein [Weissella viridescens]
MTEFEQNWKNRIFIDTAGNTSLEDLSKAKFALLAAGITTQTPSASETADTTPYYDGMGFSSHDVTGKAIQFAIAGHRLEGDAAQDYVVPKFIAIGDALKTLGKWVDAEGNTVYFVATLTAIVPYGGAANVKQTFSFTLAANGAPWLVKKDAKEAILPDGTTKPLPDGLVDPKTDQGK